MSRRVGRETEEAAASSDSFFPLAGWRRGVVVSGIRRMNEVNPRRAPVSSWMGDRLRAIYHPAVCNKPTRSTQPCIPPGSLNRVPASAEGKGRNVTSVGQSGSR